MGIFSKKRLIKDRRAGLVFHWRGAGKQNVVGYLLGLICSAVFVAVLLYGVKVDAPSFAVEQKLKAHEVVLIDEGNVKVNSLLQLESPFPEGWDPIEDELVMDRINNHTRMGLLNQKPRELELRGVLQKDGEISLPSLLPVGRYLPELNAPRRTERRKEKRSFLEITISDKDLVKRLIPNPHNEMPKFDSALRGVKKDFFISVSASGSVVLCTPLDDVEIENVEFYVRNLKFSPLANKRDKISKLTVAVEGEEK